MVQSTYSKSHQQWAAWNYLPTPKHLYKGVSNVLKHFCNTMHNSLASDAADEVMKVTKHTGLWVTELAWYSLSVNCRICLYGLEHGFRPPLTWLIIAYSSTWAVKFLQPSFYCTVINLTFTFRSTNILGYFRGEPSSNSLSIRSRIPQRSNRTNYHNTTKHNRYAPRFKLLR